MTVVTAASPEVRRRRAGAWVGMAAGLIAAGIGLAALLQAGQWTARDALDAASAGPDGSRALVEILRDQGAIVTVARSRGAAEKALREGPATLAIADTTPLADETLERLAAAAADLVLLDPRARDLRVLMPGATVAGPGEGSPTLPDCALVEAQRAGSITPGRVYGVAGWMTACYPSGDGFGLVVAEDGEHRIAALDADDLFTNAVLARGGNAALAVGVLGRHPSVVWYLPSVTDADRPVSAPTIGELTPEWVTPAIMTLLAAAGAAAIWRGRRFGPLVAERLPVTVRAAETEEGRAHLYARSGDAAHALDQLRVAALERIAHLLGLSPASTATEISDAAAALVGADRARIRALLVDTIPTGDRHLVVLADDLQQFEAAVRRAVTPERRSS